jgi:hypothetical protein
VVVYNLGVALTAQEESQYDYWSEVWTSCNARFGDDAALASSCIASKENRLAYALQMGWHPDIEGGKRHRWSPQVLGKAANMWLRAGNHCEQIVANARNKFMTAYDILLEDRGHSLVYADTVWLPDKLQRHLRQRIRCYHGKLFSERREATTVKHFKTKPDVVTTKIKTVGAATLRKEAVEAFVDPASPVRVLCVSRLPDYDSRLRGAPLLINCSGNVEITELLQPQVCVYLHCLGTYETNKLLRKQRGQQVQDITSLHEITL